MNDTTVGGECAGHGDARAAGDIEDRVRKEGLVGKAGPVDEATDLGDDRRMLLVDQLADEALRADARRALDLLGFGCLRELVEGLDRPGTQTLSRSLLHGLFRKTPAAAHELGAYQDLLDALPSLPSPSRGLAALSLTHLARSEELAEVSAALTPGLCEALGSEHAVERKEAALCLARIAAQVLHPEDCPLDQRIIDRLTLSLSDEDSAPRYAAAWALEKCGPAASSAIPQLQAHLSDPDPLVQRSAAWALERIQDL